MDAVEQFNDIYGVTIRSRFHSRRPIHSDTKTIIILKQTHSKLYHYIQSLFDNHSGKQIRAIFRNLQNKWLHPSGIQSGATNVLCMFLLHIASRNSTLQKTILFLYFDALFFHCDLYGDSDVLCRMQTYQSNVSFHKMKCFARWEALLSVFIRLLRLCSNPIDIFQQWVDTYPAGRASNCVFAHLSGVEQLLTECTNSSSINGGHLQLGIIQCFLQFILQHELLPQHIPLRQKSVCIYDRLYHRFFEKFQCIATVNLNFVYKRSLLDLMEKTFILYQHQQVSDVNAASVFVLGIKMLSDETFVNLYDRWVTICKSVALKQKTGWMERYETHLIVLVGITAHSQTIDVNYVLKLLLEMTSFLRKTDSHLPECRFVLLLIIYLAVYSRNPRNTHKPNANLLLVEFRLQFLSRVVPPHSHLYRCFQSYCVFTLKCKQNFWHKWFDIEHQDELDQDWTLGDIEDALAFRRECKTILSCIPLQSLQKWPHMRSFLSTQHQSISFRILTTKKELMALMQPPPSIGGKPAQCYLMMLPEELFARMLQFLSAKRLCRVALVSKQCHEIMSTTNSWTQNVWKALYLDSVCGKTVSMGRTRCPHGPSFHHHWAQMYQDRFFAIRKMIRRRAKKESQTLRMCAVCGCHRILNKTEMDSHLALHAEYTCTVPLCGATFCTKTALLNHHRNHTRKRKRDT
uniref:AlNc14C87G5541 protein n=1 Tax=Albugo laibachii Nc14 TaxID=890382 RepID=F0WG09_9STRA|nr:AlNc14C87G5541 [Albugo laibachii Nc14]|eukprot:CCA20143.1 AlNc14C87G5541 [Albugo laibachii Nc14]